MNPNGKVKPNVFKTFVENVLNAERVEKLRFIVEKGKSTVSSDAIAASARLCVEATEEYSSMVRRDVASKSTNSSFLVAFKKDAKITDQLDAIAMYDDKDWKIENLTRLVSTRDFARKKWFWAVYTNDPINQRILEKWVNPRPKGPTVKSLKEGKEKKKKRKAGAVITQQKEKKRKLDVATQKKDQVDGEATQEGGSS